MKRVIAAIILTFALIPLNSLETWAAGSFPGEPLSLSASEKQNIERFLDHYNWQGVRNYSGGGDPLAVIWDLAIHKPELLQKDSDGRLGLEEKLVAANALKLFGFPFDKSALPDYIESRDGVIWFPQGDGPTEGKSKINSAYKLANGNIAVLGETSLEEDVEKQPFLAIVGSNQYNRDEGLALRSQIDLQ